MMHLIATATVGYAISPFYEIFMNCRHSIRAMWATWKVYSTKETLVRNKLHRFQELSGLSINYVNMAKGGGEARWKSGGLSKKYFQKSISNFVEK